MADGTRPVECVRVQVHGRVQGVGFREACVMEARRLGVTGWVRNRRDGSVEVMMQGQPDRLARLQSWLRHGPPAARVDELVVSPVSAAFALLADFERAPTV